MINRWIGLAGRIGVGAVFLVFGTNGIAWVFFGAPFIEMSPPAEGSSAAEYFSVIGGSYILKTVKIIEVAGALMLLTGIFLPLGAVLLAPIVVNILLFHITIDPSAMGLAIFLTVGELAIAWGYCDYFKSLFTIRKGL